MARIDYDEQEAAAFRAAWHVPREGLRHWRDAVAEYLRPGAPAGSRRRHAAAATETGPVIDRLDLVVLR